LVAVPWPLDNAVIELVVYGVPAPQGSKAPYGGESNPRTKPWRAAVAAEAAEMMEWHASQASIYRHGFVGPVKVRATFFFPRPKSHYGTGKNATVLKDHAPVFHQSKPDGDKLARAIGDALTGIVFRDDSQIAVWRIEKRYGDTARCELEITSAA
jgi:Holliday junction resolvase RusA-like endonuclease